MALSAAYSGELALADEAVHAVEQLSPNPSVSVDGDLWQARSVIALLRGDIPGAVAIARDGIALSRERAMPYDEAMGWFALTQCGFAAEAVDRATELGEQLGGLAEIYALHTRGRARRDRSLLEQSAERFAAAGATAVAAAAAGDAARAARHEGDDREATRWARRAAQLASEVQTRHELMHVPERAPLSRREREVAEMAARGLTSRAIAEQLFLSTRTVENHVAQVFAKLGINSRDELPGALGR
jgi:DNA-binding CsgD family transcriptional regulator